VPKTGEHTVIVLGDAITWVWRHYVRAKGRFEVCHADFGDPCLLCTAGLGRVQSGYLPVLLVADQVTLSVTSGAWLHSGSLRCHAGSLRGQRLKLFRLRPTVNGPLRAWLPGDSVDPRRLPPAWDILNELDIRYGFADRDAPAGEEAGDREVI
jgi:hypothetical protein